MKKIIAIWALVSALMSSALTAGAQPATPSTHGALVVTSPTPAPEEPIPSIQCRESFNDCEALLPGRYTRTRRQGSPNELCSGATHTPNRGSCNASLVVRTECGIPVVSGVGTRVLTITCGCNTASHVRISDELVITCNPDLGLQATTHGCEPKPGLPSGFNYGMVRITQTRANGYLVQTLRLSRHARQEVYGLTAVPNASFSASTTAAPVTNTITNVVVDPVVSQRMREFLDGRAAAEEALNQRFLLIENELARRRNSDPSVTTLDVGLGGFYTHLFGGSDTGAAGLVVSIRHRRHSDSLAGLLIRGFAGTGFQPLVPGPGPIWAFTGTVQADLALASVFHLGLGARVGGLTRPGKAFAPNTATGTLSWFAAVAISPEFTIPMGESVNASRINLGLDVMFGIAQTAAITRTGPANPFGVVLGIGFTAAYQF